METCLWFNLKSNILDHEGLREMKMDSTRVVSFQEIQFNTPLFCGLYSLYSQMSQELYLPPFFTLLFLPHWAVLHFLISEKSIPPWGISQIKLGHNNKLAKQKHCCGKLLLKCNSPLMHMSCTSKGQIVDFPFNNYQ